MSREWKPGDVALVCNEFGVWNVAICTLRADRAEWWWRFGVADSWMPVTANARPLVVIDPEDREQVERLQSLYLRDEHDGCVDTAECMQAALREFANPTPLKPDEPTGLGAVVEAVCDCRIETQKFVRDPAARDFNLPWDAKNVARGDEVPWVASCGHHDYIGLTAVRVLSEGVTS